MKNKLLINNGKLNYQNYMDLLSAMEEHDLHIDQAVIYEDEYGQEFVFPMGGRELFIRIEYAK